PEQAPHVAHVLRIVGIGYEPCLVWRALFDGMAKAVLMLLVLEKVHAMDDRAGAEKEAGFEAGVRQQVKDARPVGPASDADEHEAELAHGRIGEHLLDVILEKPHRRGKER